MHNGSRERGAGGYITLRLNIDRSNWSNEEKFPAFEKFERIAGFFHWGGSEWRLKRFWAILERIRLMSHLLFSLAHEEILLDFSMFLAARGNRASVESIKERGIFLNARRWKIYYSQPAIARLLRWEHTLIHIHSFFFASQGTLPEELIDYHSSERVREDILRLCLPTSASPWKLRNPRDPRCSGIATPSWETTLKCESRRRAVDLDREGPKGINNIVCSIRHYSRDKRSHLPASPHDSIRTNRSMSSARGPSRSCQWDSRTSPSTRARRTYACPAS